MARIINRLLCIILFFSLWNSAVNAAVLLNDLYEIEIPVTSQDAAERSRALRLAMGDVLIKVSGSQSLEELPQLLSILGQASKYVQQYRYHQLALPADAKPGDKPPLRLWAKFDGKGIEALLHENRLPIWAGARPSVLVWLAVQDDDSRFLLTSDDSDGIHEQLIFHSRRRGIPVLLPLLDLEDRDKIGFTEVWGGFSEAVRNASERYAPDAVLSGSIYKTAGGWGARWTLLSDANDKFWSAEAGDRNTVLATGLDGMANLFASRFAIQPADQARSDMVLSVVGLNSLEDYASVNRYITKVPYILASRVVRVEADRVTFMLQIRGRESDLRQSFKLGKVLVAEDTTAGISQVSKTNSGTPVYLLELNYRLAK